MPLRPADNQHYFWYLRGRRDPEFDPLVQAQEKELEMRGSDPELGPVVDALRDDLADMQEHTRAQLADMQERLDFAERLLTAGRASQEDRSG